VAPRKARKIGETVDYTKDPSEITKANAGLVKNAFTHTVWCIAARM
jgi:hypothetical protein